MISEKFYVVTMSDGSAWAVPISIIALDRARHYKCEFEGDLDRSLKEDTLPLFEEDPREVHDWAAGNMDWADVADVAVKIRTKPLDYEECWANGPWAVEERK